MSGFLLLLQTPLTCCICLQRHDQYQRPHGSTTGDTQAAYEEVC